VTTILFKQTLVSRRCFCRSARAVRKEQPAGGKRKYYEVRMSSKRPYRVPSRRIIVHHPRVDVGRAYMLSHLEDFLRGWRKRWSRDGDEGGRVAGVATRAAVVRFSKLLAVGYTCCTITAYRIIREPGGTCIHHVT